jgi:hypothetical protein
MYNEDAYTARQSDNPQSFISLKHGRWRPVDVPPGTLAVMYRGLWRAAFRSETDEEYFAAHPDAKFRLVVRPSRVYREYFTFKITTRDPEVYATGDSGDIRHYRPDQGSPRENMIAECERMLTDSNRCRNSERWLASQVTHQ